MIVFSLKCYGVLSDLLVKPNEIEKLFCFGLNIHIFVQKFMTILNLLLNLFLFY